MDTLGSDPKFMAPEIRSTPEMIDAMNDMIANGMTIIKQNVHEHIIV